MESSGLGSSSSRKLVRPRQRLSHSDSESNIGSNRPVHQALSSSVSGSFLEGPHQESDSLAAGRWHSDSNLKLPPIVPTGAHVGVAHQYTGSDSLDEMEKSQRKKWNKDLTWANKTDAGSTGFNWPENYGINRRFSWSDSVGSHSCHSRTSSFGSTHSHSDDPFYSSPSHTNDTLAEGSMRRRAESHGNIAEKLQPLYERPETSSPVPQTYSDHTHHTSHTHITTLCSDHTAIACSDHTHTTTPPLDISGELTTSEQFHQLMSARAEEESLPIDSPMPTQETIEGAGLYDPNVNRLPDSTEAELQLGEDRELQTFTDTVQETAAMIVRDTLDRVKVQYTKVIERYREQVTMLRKEHEGEKCHLQKQIDLEKNRAQEGVALQKQMGNELEELKSQVGTLQSMRQQYEGKKQQVVELRKRLHESEEELRVVRKDMVKQNKKVSKLVPLPSLPAGPGQERMLREMEETQAYLDSMSPHIPDETSVKDELTKRLRVLKKRPFTTGMLHKEPNHRGGQKEN